MPVGERKVQLRDRWGNEAHLPDPSGLTTPVVGWDATDEKPEWIEAEGLASHILLADSRATPFAFSDMLQMDDGADFMWSD